MPDSKHNAEERPKHGTTRPGGRTAAVRKAVTRAVLQLLSEGKTELPAAELAQRAGVNRSTIHRRWPTRLDLVRDALSVHTSQIQVPDSGSWRRDAELLFQALTDFCADPVEMGLNAAMATAADPEFNRWIIDHWTQRANDLVAPVRKAISRGELSPDTDPVALINLILGPIVMWSVLSRQVPSASLSEQMLQQVLQIGTLR